MTAMENRRRLFWDLFDFSSGRGLEIGPLHRTIVTREAAAVSYVDVHDREGIVAHYAGDPDVDTDLIPEIDYALVQEDGQVLGLAEAAAAGAPFDWVVASHVIEHVPDLIGWLDDLAELVADGGALVLAVPDKRYCFDAHRPETTVGQMLQARLSGDRIPSVRAVYDHFSRAVAADAAQLWRGEAPSNEARIHGPAFATGKIAESLAGEYIDCHVWLFSPDSFLWQMRELRELGHSSWYVAELHRTPVNDLEFTAVLRRIPRGMDTTAELADEHQSKADRPEWLDTEALEHRVEHLSREVQQLQAKLERRGARIERLSARVAHQRRRAEEAQRRLAVARPEWTAKRVVRAVTRRLPRRP